MWKEAVAAYFKVLLHYSPGGAQESHRNLGEDNLFPDGDVLPPEPKETVISSTFCGDYTYSNE